MKIETLTPQILALYIGQKCDFEREGKTVTGNIWGVFSSGIVRLTSVIESIGNEIEYNTRTFEQITPHLCRLDSLTEAEARELYEIKYGEAWGVDFERLGMEVESCLERFWKEDIELYAPEGKLLIGSPAVWLHLLSLGFDLFGLIDAGLAKEITNP